MCWYKVLGKSFYRSRSSSSACHDPLATRSDQGIAPCAALKKGNPTNDRTHAVHAVRLIDLFACSEDQRYTARYACLLSI